MRNKFLSVTVVVIFASLWAAAQTHGPVQLGAPGFAPSSAGSAMFEPENGALEKDSYVNKYFDLSLALLPDWREDYSGPNPSVAGYYVLETLRPKGELTGTLLITAQDTFFRPVKNSMELLRAQSEIRPFCPHSILRLLPGRSSWPVASSRVWTIAGLACITPSSPLMFAAMSSVLRPPAAILECWKNFFRAWTKCPCHSSPIPPLRMDGFPAA